VKTITLLAIFCASIICFGVKAEENGFSITVKNSTSQTIIANKNIIKAGEKYLLLPSPFMIDIVQGIFHYHFQYSDDTQECSCDGGDYIEYTYDNNMLTITNIVQPESELEITFSQQSTGNISCGGIQYDIKGTDTKLYFREIDHGSVQINDGCSCSFSYTIKDTTEEGFKINIHDFDGYGITINGETPKPEGQDFDFPLDITYTGSTSK
jgi:hypothetical protein